MTRTAETGRFVAEARVAAGGGKLVAEPAGPVPGRSGNGGGGKTRREMGLEEWKRRGQGPVAGR
jgi:hypothetical protein